MSPSLQCVDVHLKFVAFLLQDGALYIPTRRAVELWETLISNPNTCPGDRMVRDTVGLVHMYKCIYWYL